MKSEQAMKKIKKKIIEAKQSKDGKTIEIKIKDNVSEVLTRLSNNYQKTSMLLKENNFLLKKLFE